MEALIYQGKDQVAVEDRPVPTPGSGEVLIKVKNAGVCGTDLSIVAGMHPRAQTGLVMGHEFSGTIEQINSNNGSDFSPGDRVVVEPLITCGKCYACRSGYSYVCQNLGLYGIDQDGAFASYVKVAEDKVFKIPDSMPFELGALIEPVAVGVHAVRLSDVKLSDTVCVLGAGPIGIITAMVVSELGLRNLVVCEVQPHRIELAREYGFNTIDAANSDPVAEVEKLTDGRGADVVFEVAGSAKSILTAPKVCRVRGEIIQVAMPKKLREMNIVDLTFKELTLKGVRVYAPYDFERAIQIVSKSNFDYSKLLSKPYKLEDCAAAFKAAKAGEDVMKVLFEIQ